MSKKLNNDIETCFKYIFKAKKGKTKPASLMKVIERELPENYFCHFPYGIDWQITSCCNLRCKHCLYYERQEKFNPNNDLKTDEILELAKFFVEEINIISFGLTGGEAFLFPDILKLLEYLTGQNVKITVLSNGTLITPELAKKLGELLDPKQHSIRISLEGINPKTHNLIRGEGSFEKTCKGIKYLTDNNVNVSAAFTVNSLNVKELPDLGAFCKKINVNRISIGGFVPYDDKQLYLLPNLDDVIENTAGLIQKAEQNLKLNLRHLKVFDFLNYEFGKELLDRHLKEKQPSTKTNCSCHKHNRFTLCADGKMYLCPAAENEKFCLGNLKTQAFPEIWANRFNNELFQERNAAKMDFCKNCKYIDLCKGGCMIEAYQKHGKINAPQKTCNYYKTLQQN